MDWGGGSGFDQFHDVIPDTNSTVDIRRYGFGWGNYGDPKGERAPLPRELFAFILTWAASGRPRPGRTLPSWRWPPVTHLSQYQVRLPPQETVFGDWMPMGLGGFTDQTVFQRTEHTVQGLPNGVKHLFRI